MDPAALMWTKVGVVGSIEVGDEHTLKCFSQYFSHDWTPPTVAIEEILHHGSTKTPEISVSSIFSPSSLVAVNNRSTPNVMTQVLVRRLGDAGYRVENFHKFSPGKVKMVECVNVVLDHSNREATVFSEDSNGAHDAK